jgi:hypothetical protein
MDIPLAVEWLIAGAKYTRAKTYEELRRTWTDTRRLPTEAELAAAWVEYLEYQATNAVKLEELRIKRQLLHNQTELDELTFDARQQLLVELLRSKLPVNDLP